MYKIMTWDEFREICQTDAFNWHDAGYKAEELTEQDILNEYPIDYFDIPEYKDTDDLSSCFSPEEFAEKTLEYLSEMNK